MTFWPGCLPFFNLVIPQRVSETFDMAKNRCWNCLVLCSWVKGIETIPYIKVHSWVLEDSFTLTVKVASGWRINKEERWKIKLFPLASWEKTLKVSSKVSIFPWSTLKYLFHNNCVI